MNTKTFYIKGSKCASCKIIIEEEINQIKGIDSADFDLNTKKLIITSDNNGSDFFNEAKSRLSQHGYIIDITENSNRFNLKNFFLGSILASIFIYLFISYQKLGLESYIGSPSSNLLAPFFIGFIASLSSCLAVVGGLVLALSSQFSKISNSWRPQLSFHIGRLLGFFFLGGLLGIVGAFFQLSIYTHALINILVGMFMFSNGLSLIDGLKFANKFSFGSLILNLAMRYSKVSGNMIIPFAVGSITFFLPCGFTQSMQFYALQSGSFINASTIMIAFALGTLPALLFVSYTSHRLSQSKYAPIFFNAAACVIIFLGIHSIYTALKILNIT